MAEAVSTQADSFEYDEEASLVRELIEAVETHIVPRIYRLSQVRLNKANSTQARLQQLKGQFRLSATEEDVGQIVMD